MRAFIGAIFALIIPLISFIVFERIILPPDYFNFRNWEALQLESNFLFGKFMPDVTIHKKEVGDLAVHTEYSIVKDVRWEIDQAGYRNDELIENPTIVTLGDSFFVGTSNDQKDTFASILSRKCDVSVYNVSPSNLRDLDELLSNNVIAKPKLVIVGYVERYLHKIDASISSSQVSAVKQTVFANPRLKSTAVFFARLNKSNFREWFRSKINPKASLGRLSFHNKKMFFLKKEKTSNLPDQVNVKIDRVISEVSKIQKYLNGRGINFLFIPVPDKRSVYFDFDVKEGKTHFLNVLENRLSQKNIHNFNALKALLDFRKKIKDKHVLYHLDDTHWNKLGTEVIASDLLSELPHFCSGKI